MSWQEKILRLEQANSSSGPFDLFELLQDEAAHGYYVGASAHEGGAIFNGYVAAGGLDANAITDGCLDQRDIVD